RADKAWGLLSPQQQAALPKLVKHQGSTSAIWSLAWELGFNYDNVILSYPMLAEVPVRERLRLNAEQEKQLHAVMADNAARLKKVPLDSPELDAETGYKQRVDAILTPQQLKTLKEIDFRRKVV